MAEEKHTRFIWDKELEQVVPYAEWITRQYKASRAHYVIQDTMEPTLNLADGNWYDTKSGFRRVYKAKGLEEVGNEWRDLPPEKYYPEYKPESCRETLAKVMRGELPAVTPREAAEILGRS